MPPADLTAKLRAAVEAALVKALPCVCDGEMVPCPSDHFTAALSAALSAVLAAILPIVAEAQRGAARRWGVWPISHGWYASWQKREGGSGFDPEDAESVARISRAIGVTVEEVRAAIDAARASARTPEAGDGE